MKRLLAYLLSVALLLPHLAFAEDDAIPASFKFGADVSTVLSEENSGVVYRNRDGEPTDLFVLLKEAGWDTVRVRVWNDPFDEDGRGYGGGNCGVANSVEIARRCKEAGLSLIVDFHYSDFWADPAKQMSPKAWVTMDLTQKCSALYAFTTDALTQIAATGVDIWMVQVGNEINNGMSGEEDVDTVMDLIASGSRAVREIAKDYGKDIKVAVHYTNIEDYEEVDTRAANLQNAGVDYDLFGLSYYPYWDGTMENMQAVAENIENTYGKDVYIAETSYCYTTEDGDGFANSFAGTEDLVDGYVATVQSQATMIHDICAAADEAGALGVFYWEGTWIPVGDADADNTALWEKYGSGWASSYSADYDPDDAGL